MTTFETCFAALRALLHTDTVNIAEQLHDLLVKACEHDRAQTIEVLCPYVEDIVQHRVIESCDVEVMEDDFQHARYVPSFYWVPLNCSEWEDNPVEALAWPNAWYDAEIGDDALAHAQAIMASDVYSRIRDVGLFCSLDAFLDAFTQPMVHLTKLCLFKSFTSDHIRVFNTSWLKTTLTSFYTCGEFSDALFPELDLTWSAIETLGFDDGRTEGGLETLFRTQSFERLHQIYCSWTHVTPATLHALCDADLPCLQLLWLNRARVTGEGAMRLLCGSTMPRLRFLHLHGAALTDDQCEAIAQQPAHHRLTLLDLSASNISDAGVHALAQWPGLQYVETLSLDQLPLTEDAIHALSNSSYTSNLSAIKLDQPTDQMRTILAQGKHFRTIPQLIG